MGNSLLDILVFGRRAGESAAAFAKDAKPGKLTLDHIKKYHKELEKAKIKGKIHSPILLPDYRREETKGRYVGVF